MKISAGLGGCYPPRPKAEVDNTLRDLQTSSYPTKAELPFKFSLFLKASLDLLTCKLTSFSNARMSTKTRFEEEAKGNSEMAYFVSFFNMVIPSHPLTCEPMALMMMLLLSYNHT